MEGGKGGEFAWRDGPLLAALKAGHWVVLDEVRNTNHAVLVSTGFLCLDSIFRFIVMIHLR